MWSASPVSRRRFPKAMGRSGSSAEPASTKRRWRMPTTSTWFTYPITSSTRTPCTFRPSIRRSGSRVRFCLTRTSRRSRVANTGGEARSRRGLWPRLLSSVAFFVGSRARGHTSSEVQGRPVRVGIRDTPWVSTRTFSDFCLFPRLGRTPMGARLRRARKGTLGSVFRFGQLLVLGVGGRAHDSRVRRRRAARLLARAVDDLEDARRSDGLACSADDSEFLQGFDDLAKLVTASAHVAHHGGYVLLVLIDFEGDAIVSETMAPSTLARIQDRALGITCGMLAGRGGAGTHTSSMP